MARKRILISGGNGYVGREVTRRLYNSHEVCVVDIVRYGDVRFRSEELEKFRFEKQDITDAPGIARLMSSFRPDIIIHLAAVHYIPECENNPQLAVKTNVDGTLILVSACPAGTRFVFASSGAVYCPEEVPHSESTSPIGPSDVYGLTKLHGEQYVSYFAAQRNLSAVNVRLFNVIGPGETNPHLLPEIVAQLKAGRKVVKVGNLKPKRDYIHVSDASNGFVEIALTDQNHDGKAAEFNLGSSLCYSVEEVLRRLRRISGIDFSIEIDTARVRSVDRPFMAACISKIRDNFDWSPKFTLDTALEDLWQKPDLNPNQLAKYATSAL